MSAVALGLGTVSVITEEHAWGLGTLAAILLLLFLHYGEQEGAVYFLREDVAEKMKRTDALTRCPFRGTTS